MAARVILAYSGGLDTSIAIRWLIEKYDVEVITLTVDLGGSKNIDGVQARAIQSGATKSFVIDAREQFVNEFVWPALQAGAIYEGVYPLATALARPLIAQLQVEVARQEDAFAVAHGCTGKGNDQVRFDVNTAALGPDLKILAPAREWGMSRGQEIEYAHKHNIPLDLPKDTSYSIDENLWGRSIEAGDLEDTWLEPPENAFAWTRSVTEAPNESAVLEIQFDKGIPTALDGENLNGVALIETLNRLAGEHSIGRIDHVENRLVGIKSREVYEAPAGTVLHIAHRALETLTLGKNQSRFKAHLAQEYADVVYNGLWFTPHRQDLDAYVQSVQRFVSGTIRVRLHKGSCTVVGRKSNYSIYQHELATYDKGDQFDNSASEGFISIYGLPVRTQARAQRPATES
jgi:argininosuccinate synthase